ncbi:hypothetical protein CIHG_00090 [Coccidioides immitis H538.4]|uniref:Uncharacterized protein n=1 Tax=Coccidioides immitis H538.4 TaxID=396776 RepID=A0A0J8RCQ5_COCIT|nr:hypothetical protein CIHG_00090 [Coccidioides immitis H538.4]
MVVLVGTADAVWTCPSGRDPLCCARYTDEGKVEGVVIGSECNEAPRTARCGDASNPLCCKPNDSTPTSKLNDGFSAQAVFHTKR